MRSFFGRISPQAAAVEGFSPTITLSFLLWFVLTMAIPVKAEDQSTQADCLNSQILGEAIENIDGAIQKVIGACSLSELKEILLSGRRPPTARYVAVYALERLKSMDAPALTQALHDDDNGVLERTVQALGQMGATAEMSVLQLIQLLEKHEQNRRTSTVRANVTYALGQILKGSQDTCLSSKAVLALIEALKDENETVRANAAYALGQIGLVSQSAVLPLIGVLRDDTEKVQANAAHALGQIKPVEQNAILVLIDMLKSENNNLRSAATYALGEMQPDTTQALQALTDAIKNKDTDVRINVAKLLGQIGSAKPDTIPKIIQPLVLALEDDSSDVRIVAIRSLTQVSRACQLKRDKIAPQSDRTFCGIGLDSVGLPILKYASISQAFLNVLENSLRNRDINSDDISIAVAYGLGEVGSANDEMVTKKLFNLLCKENVSDDIRIVAVDALGKIYSDTRKKVQSLLCSLEDRNLTVRAVAAAALGTVGWDDPEVITALSNIVKNKEDDDLVRMISNQSLKRLAKSEFDKLQYDDEVKKLNLKETLTQLLSTNRPGVREVVECIRKFLEGKRC